MYQRNGKLLLSLILLLGILLLGAGCSGNDGLPASPPLDEPAPVIQEEPESPPAEPGEPEEEPAEQDGDVSRIDDPNEGLLIVHFVDVGQGDACLIELPSGETMLIDGGEKSAFDDLQTYLQEQDIDRIDHLIATHPHADHIGGLIGIVKEFDIGNVYMPRVAHTTVTYKDLLEAIKEKGLKVTEAKAGVAVDTGDGTKAEFVAPCIDDYDDLNDYSAVLRLTYGQVSFLFTGDAEAVSEADMLAGGADLQAEVLKVGHHGSNSSTSQEFLEAVSPGYAVISVGADNDYGHPHQELLARLEDFGAEILRTDLMGHIVFTCNDQKIISVLTSADYLEKD